MLLELSQNVTAIMLDPPKNALLLEDPSCAPSTLLNSPSNIIDMRILFP